MSWDLTQFVNAKLKPYRETFTLSPKQLRKFATTAKLDWAKVKFTAGNHSFVPLARGVYAFVVEHNISQLPPHGYVMYVGITGDSGKHNLRRRYGNYLRDKRIDKRAGIHYMLNNWAASMYFHYAVVSDKRYSLATLESQIADALIPPFNKQDFSAEIRKATKAF
jgi:hypothetical protein